MKEAIKEHDDLKEQAGFNVIKENKASTSKKLKEVKKEEGKKSEGDEKEGMYDCLKMLPLVTKNIVSTRTNPVIESVNAKLIFGKKKKKKSFLRNFIAALIFMLER